MEYRQVSSTSIAVVGYEPASRTLEVVFHRGSVYRYSAVPADVYAALVAASSIGSYFSKHIRGRYETWKRVREAPTPGP